MKRLLTTALLALTVIMAIPAQAGTCTAVNARGMHWTYTFPNTARAAYAARTACFSVSSSCIVHCN